jgi:hypothetical protein
MKKEWLLSKMRELIKQNQFSEGEMRGQFGTNTDFISRQQYHPSGKENVVLTPQLFLTYMGLQALKYIYHPEFENRIYWVEEFSKSCLKSNFVGITMPFESPERDDMSSNIAINYRHSAIAHTLLTDISISNEPEKRFVHYLIDKDIQTSSGGWPEWNLQPDSPNIISSVYMAHFLFKFHNKYPEDSLNISIKNMILSTLDYLDNNHTDGFWHQKEKEATIRFYPTLYLLAFPIYLFYKGKNCKVIKDYPNLVKRLSEDNLIQLENRQKIFRTTLRYTINLYFHSFFSKNNRAFFEKYRDNILTDVTNHFSELNSHEIFGTCLLIDSIDHFEIPDNEYFHIFFENSRLLGSSLVKRLKAIEIGNKKANQYHKVVLEIFNFLFHRILENPKKEQKIHNGRKRVDIVYFNNAKNGFFYNLSLRHNVFCPYIIIECKNYNQDLKNPEYDQICGRFSKNRGKFGIITCRKIIDKKKVIEDCKHIISDGRGYVLVIDDNDLINLINAKIENNKILDDYLERKMMEVLF